MSHNSDLRHIEKNGMGKTPDDIKQKCLELCQYYLAGFWTKQTVDTIYVKRLTGGLLNQLYYCAINHQIEGTVNEKDNIVVNGVPKEVAIKFYQKKNFNLFRAEELNDFDKELELNDSLISLMASENNLGPKVYGVFNGGVILKYYQQKPFRAEEQKDPELVREVFEKMARFHAMDVPIKRTTNNIYFEQFNHVYKLAQETSYVDDMVEANVKVFVENDFHAEYVWIKQIISNIGSPVVFTHNDYRSDNLMVLTDHNNNRTNRVVVCDYDTSCYGFRGFDFIAIIKEWGNDNACLDFRNVYFPPEDYILKDLFRHYFNESVVIFGQNYAKNPKNSVENLIKELKVFTLVLQFCYVLPLGRILDPNHVIPEDMLIFFGGKQPDRQTLMKMSEVSYENYWKLKNKFLEQQVFQ